METSGLRPGFNMIIPFDRKGYRDRYLEIVRDVVGLSPETSMNTEHVQRARYPFGRCCAVVEFVTPDILLTLGIPEQRSISVFTVEDPYQAARFIGGHVAFAHGEIGCIDAHDVFGDLTPKEMYFVQVDGFPLILLCPAGEQKDGVLSGFSMLIPFIDPIQHGLYVDIVEDCAGIAPQKTPGAGGNGRVLYPPGLGRAIVNVSDRRVLNALGIPALHSVCAFAVRDPRACAVQAYHKLELHGYYPTLIDGHNAETDLPGQFMYFVHSAGFPLMLFWPREPTAGQLDMLPQPIPWNWVNEVG